MDEQSQVDVRKWEFAGPVERAYELAKAPTTMIIGPTGGGKTTGSARRALRIATWQQPSPKDGKRKARILCLCPTYRRAWDTIIPSWHKVWPESMGIFRGSRGDPADHIFEIDLMIGGVRSTCHVETLFRAVNDQDVEDFFRGFEITAMHLPEADTNSDLDAILSLGRNRIGRYPEPDDRPDNGEVGFKGIHGDANAPMIGTPFHRRFYLKRMADDKRAPDTDRVYVQPSGYSPNAENIKNLRKIDPKYYENMAAELDEYDVRRLIENKPGYGRHGQPVHPNFNPDRHVATRSIEVDPLLTVYIGIDAGSGTLQPGATFSQRAYNGQWRTFAEIYLGKGGSMNMDELSQSIRQVLNTRCGRVKAGALICIDPAARDRNSHSEITTAQYIQHHSGVEVQFAPDNDPKKRRTAIDRILKATVDGTDPKKLIDPDCVGLIQGYTGGFHYPKRGSNVALHPSKNEFSHVCEADEYAAYTVDGVDASEGRFIRPGGEADYGAPQTLMES